MRPKPRQTHPRANRRFTIVIKSEKEGGYSGRCLELPGAISQGETLKELRANMIDAINLTLKYLRSRAKAAQKKIVIELPA
jgi:predicted RNase H-like HicB family nuclease